MLVPVNVSVPVPSLVSPPDPPAPTSGEVTVSLNAWVSIVTPPASTLTVLTVRNAVLLALARSVPPLKLNVLVPLTPWTAAAVSVAVEPTPLPRL